MRIEKRGFTLLEVIVSIVLIAIIMIPLGLISIEYVRSIAYADTLTQASNLARLELARVNSLPFGSVPIVTDQIQSYPAYASFDVKRTVISINSNAKRVIVRVFRQGSLDRLIELTTYIGNVLFGTGSAGGGLGNEGDYFLATGGSFTTAYVHRVSFRNRPPNPAMPSKGNITVVGVKLMSDITRTLTRISMGGATVGDTYGIRREEDIVLPANTRVSVPFEKTFIMNPYPPEYATLNERLFVFLGNYNGQTTLRAIFLFSDGTESQEFTWSR